jgi:hypothetical protein
VPASVPDVKDSISAPFTSAAKTDGSRSLVRMVTTLSIVQAA